MKKHIAIITAALLLIAGIIIGYRAGIRHAIEDSEIWTTERYDPEDPDSSAWGEYDQRIIIELDGELYEHGMFQG